jgi:hypothetical protein
LPGQSNREVSRYGKYQNKQQKQRLYDVEKACEIDHPGGATPSIPDALLQGKSHIASNIDKADWRQPAYHSTEKFGDFSFCAGNYRMGVEWYLQARCLPGVPAVYCSGEFLYCQGTV